MYVRLSAIAHWLFQPITDLVGLIDKDTEKRLLWTISFSRVRPFNVLRIIQMCIYVLRLNSQ